MIYTIFSNFRIQLHGNHHFISKDQTKLYDVLCSSMFSQILLHLPLHFNVRMYESLWHDQGKILATLLLLNRARCKRQRYVFASNIHVCKNVMQQVGSHIWMLICIVEYISFWNIEILIPLDEYYLSILFEICPI